MHISFPLSFAFSISPRGTLNIPGKLKNVEILNYLRREERPANTQIGYKFYLGIEKEK